MVKYGIDVSYHQGKIDFTQVRKNAEFVIMRAGIGNAKDTKFEDYYAECKRLKIPVGCYWYSYAKSVSEIQTEADVFLQAIQGKTFEYPVYLDFEESSQFALGKSKCSEMAKAFLDILENAGYYAGTYSSKSHLENYFTEDILKRYTVWVAHYGVSKTSYKYPFDMWQYSADGSVPGISHRCDMNYCYKDDFPEIIKSAGLNGFVKTSDATESHKKSIDELAKEVLENKWGTGADRKARLTAAGYSYEAVQNAVNVLLKTSADETQLIDAPEDMSVENNVESVEITLTADGKTYSGTLTKD